MKKTSAARKTIIHIYSSPKSHNLWPVISNSKKSIIKDTALALIGLEESNTLPLHSSIPIILKEQICSIIIRRSLKIVIQSLGLILIFSLETYFLYSRQAIMSLTCYYRMTSIPKEIRNGFISGLQILQRTLISR